MDLKDFQIEKIEELFSFTKDNYEQSNKTAYLRAPTGSGKTIILGNYIKKVISLLKEKKYTGPFIMQAYRDDEGVEIFRRQLRFFLDLLDQDLETENL